jgi:selenocysteine lyase/cysteine desulfurase
MNHFFNPTTSLSDKLGFAGSSYEAVQSIPEIVSYLGGSNPGPVFEAITTHEGTLQKILLDFLNGRNGVTVHGISTPDERVRVPTVSFTVEGKSSRQIVEDAEKIGNFGFRWGHFYSKRLCDEVLGLSPEAVARVSMVHYNTEEEIRNLVEVLDKVLP